MTGSTAARRFISRLICGAPVAFALLLGCIDFELVIWAARCGRGIRHQRGEPFDRIADELLDAGMAPASVWPSLGLPGSACARTTNWPPLLCLRVVATLTLTPNL